MADSPTISPLDADDPRISEWIDGRLAPDEAAEIERAVAASAELSQLVEDLRAIRAAMRTEATGVPTVDLGDRIMAAIASANGNGQRATAASRMNASAPTGRRSLPWLALAGALAAGVLVTVVVNIPNDDGREIALAPGTNKDLEAAGRREARRQLSEKLGDQESAVAKEAEDRVEVAQDPAAGSVGGELLLQERLRDDDKGALPSEAAPLDALAANAAPAAPPPAAASVPQGEAARLAAAKPRTEAVQETQAFARGLTKSGLAKRAKVDLAGVLVIAVTNPSERRALDRLVVESGLDATPEKDHLELVGTVAAVEAFLEELRRVGLVSAVPARRTVEEGKLEAAAKRDAPTATLILRVVERKGKKTEPAAAAEGGAKP